MTRLRVPLSAAAAVLLVTACGGSDDSAPPPPPAAAETQMQREDREASATIAGLIAFAKAQLASYTSEATEPRAIGGINPPTSETAEPLPL